MKETVIEVVNISGLFLTLIYQKNILFLMFLTEFQSRKDDNEYVIHSYN